MGCIPFFKTTAKVVQVSWRLRAGRFLIRERTDPHRDANREITLAGQRTA
jgi:hypothetical protein